MHKLHHNKTLLLLLITVFLTAQWSATHIHLAAHHDHDGDHHQHNIQAHAHQASSYHADTIDSAHAAGDYKVVELDNDCTSSGWKKIGDQLSVSILVPYQLLFVPNPSCIQLPEQNSNKHGYITYSTTRLRAPPHIS
ncbi:MAG: hypothetical protein OQK98_06300 [Gammaproteobacteria bacterium]|nr:hypothetical protein [Gammaproteobacteria bacterium]